MKDRPTSGAEKIPGGSIARGCHDGLFVMRCSTTGCAHGNGRAFRLWLEQWWFDASAKALSEGYREYTGATGVGGKIRTMDCIPIEPGDLAITTDGIHALVYAGEGKWIQADPGLGIVATLDGRTDVNPWFRIPVTIHRWRLFDPQP